jgi:hypothetical protein
MTDHWLADAADAVVAQISPLLHGKGPGVQGAVCADLTAIWLAGHPPELREALLDMQVELIRQLAAFYSMRRRLAS